MTVYSQNNRILFVHIPKTAGKSIRKGLSSVREVKNDITQNNNYHSTYSHCEQSLENLESYFKFTVVRNPWDRACSWFFFRKKLIEKNLDGSFKNLRKDRVDLLREYECMNDDFNSWLERYIDVPWDFTWFSLGHSQMTWISNVQNFDKICRFETLSGDLKELNIKIPHSNRSDNSLLLYRDLFNQNSKKIIEKYFAEDIDLFDYGF